MKNEDQEFDFASALKLVQDGKPILGNEGILTPLIKRLTEEALEGVIPILARRSLQTGAMAKAVNSSNP